MQLSSVLQRLLKLAKNLISGNPDLSGKANDYMNPLPELVKGLELLKPFLTKQGFKFDNYENDKGSGGQFTIATFTNGNKKFVIGYRFSIGYVIYQYCDYTVNHSYYLDGLGYAEQKQFPGFQSEDKLRPFRYILHDFDFLINDFFAGDCSELKIIAKQQKESIEECNRNAQEEYKYHHDKLNIYKARQEFKDKNYKTSLTIYNEIEYPEILSDFDRKAISYCKNHL
ncbi:hypothetical protein GCM10028824_00620 [Hymenobacter segetis]|uniref:Uncharacterized protein n=1 Tax=Hymenobacter segetis TaxID=2025509 RepID=A0ABU9LZF9_9BACT